jgi:hypothetical protein
LMIKEINYELLRAMMIEKYLRKREWLMTRKEWMFMLGNRLMIFLIKEWGIDNKY